MFRFGLSKPFVVDRVVLDSLEHKRMMLCLNFRLGRHDRHRSELSCMDQLKFDVFVNNFLAIFVSLNSYFQLEHCLDCSTDPMQCQLQLHSHVQYRLSIQSNISGENYLKENNFFIVLPNAFLRFRARLLHLLPSRDHRANRLGYPTETKRT